MFFVEQVLIRGLHVLAASFWLGAAIVMAGFLAPAARAVGAPGSVFMRHLNGKARLPLVTNMAALITILTGVWLLWRASSGLQVEWFGTSYGLTLSIGVVAALAAYGVSMFVQRPAMQRIAIAQSATEQPDQKARAELAGAQFRLTLGGRIGAVLLAVSAVCMAVARYV
ncbi:DUF2269 family protein [Wenzhouxiangella sp. EGI_FJ10305]|uniref:DUF2269 family protein n=1 Tax=Wenzhouxiangella sp. EGI_FJ10305 TaxID=3243768 RepID=UPI0035DA9F26